MLKIIKKVEEFVKFILEKYGFDLVDIEFKKEGRSYFLRVYIDKFGGIIIDDCQFVSEEFFEKFDIVDFILFSYYLEVLLLGVDRFFVIDRDFIRNRGRVVDVFLNQFFLNCIKIIGEFVEKNEKFLVLIVDKEKIDIFVENIKKVKFVIRF